jgi:RimJ/RimL family protein N-acetyltransferase
LLVPLFPTRVVNDVCFEHSHSEVSRVIAETYPELKPSIRVMEKNGLVYVDDGSEPGVIRYELKRAAFIDAKPR